MPEGGESGQRRLAVIGAGLMGHAIAFVFAAHGWRVSIWDRADESLRSLDERWQDCAVGTGMPVPEIRIAATLADCAEAADLVIEAVAENVEIKQAVLREAVAAAPSAILASNTSVIPIHLIAAGLPSEARFVGTHWWNPPHLIRIVEVVAGPLSSAETVEQVRGWLAGVGKLPVDAPDIPGFIGNRLQFALWREAMHLVEIGAADPETIDTVARETFGRRLPALGPLENADYIGLPLTRDIMQYVLPSLATDQSPPAALTERLESGRTGAAGGAGFYEWRAGERESTRRRLMAQLQRTSHDEENDGSGSDE